MLVVKTMSLLLNRKRYHMKDPPLARAGLRVKRVENLLGGILEETMSPQPSELLQCCSYLRCAGIAVFREARELLFKRWQVPIIDMVRHGSPEEVPHNNHVMQWTGITCLSSRYRDTDNLVEKQLDLPLYPKFHSHSFLSVIGLSSYYIIYTDILSTYLTYYSPMWHDMAVGLHNYSVSDLLSFFTSLAVVVRPTPTRGYYGN